MIKWLKSLFNTENKPEDIICPVCGYYCIGKGGIWCIDKLSLYEENKL